MAGTIESTVMNTTGIIALVKQDGMKMKRSSDTYKIKDEATDEQIYNTLEALSELIDPYTFDSLQLEKRVNSMF